MDEHRLWIDGAWEGSSHRRELHAPFDGRVLALVCEADAAQMSRALDAAVKAFESYRRSSRWLRGRLLAGIARGIDARRQELVRAIVDEAGKPRTLADGEVSRAIGTFTLGAEEAVRRAGEQVPVDTTAGHRGFAPAVVSWVPRGPVLAIGPFNYPLNLLAHKIAPALASGCSVLVKPPPQAPGAAMLLADIFSRAAREAGDGAEQVPMGVVQVLSAPNEVVALAVTDPRVATLSFTGSDKVGWLLQGQAARKKVALELGGNAAVIVHDDADIGRAAARCAYGAFSYAGQICISVQRIFVHEDVAHAFLDRLLAETARLEVGDPAGDRTLVGPLIDGHAADRVLAWIYEAKSGGARLHCGGERHGSIVTPTVLTGTRPDMHVNADEVFGPVVTVERYTQIDDAIARVNASRFGLQAGIFSDSDRVLRRGSERIDAGGILLNEIPTTRADNMPYGGMKDSGLGREGVRYAMEDMSERKVVLAWRGGDENA